MATQIYYFSRSGFTKLAAKGIAEKLKGSVIKLSDGDSYKGIFGFIKGGFRAVTKKDVTLDGIYTNLIGLINHNKSRNTTKWLKEYVGRIYR